MAFTITYDAKCNPVGICAKCDFIVLLHCSGHVLSENNEVQIFPHITLLRATVQVWDLSTLNAYLFFTTSEHTFIVFLGIYKFLNTLNLIMAHYDRFP